MVVVSSVEIKLRPVRSKASYCERTFSDATRSYQGFVMEQFNSTMILPVVLLGDSTSNSAQQPIQSVMYMIQVVTVLLGVDLCCAWIVTGPLLMGKAGTEWRGGITSGHRK